MLFQLAPFICKPHPMVARIEKAKAEIKVVSLKKQSGSPTHADAMHMIHCTLRKNHEKGFSCWSLMS